MSTEYARPNLPYMGQQSPYNNRYHILTTAKKPLKAEHLDGEMNYIVDSLNKLDNAVKGINAGVVPGSGLRASRDKILVTDGDTSPTLSWVKVGSVHITDYAIEGRHIYMNSITEEKICDGAITPPKLVQGAVAWGERIGKVKATPHTLVSRGDGGVVNVGALECVNLARTKGLEADEGLIVTLRTNTVSALTMTADVVKAKRLEADEIDVKNLEIGKILQKALDDLFDQEHPVGSCYFHNPRYGQMVNGRRVIWTRIRRPSNESGKLLLAIRQPGDEKSSRFQGKDYLTGDWGRVQGHKIKIDEIPSEEPGHKKDRVVARIIMGDTVISPREHKHKVDAKRYETPFYERTN